MVQRREDIVRSERITRERTQSSRDHQCQEVEGAYVRKIEAHIGCASPNDLYEERQGTANGAEDDLTERPEWAVCQASGKEEGRE
jgi:hypothetical protein